MYEQHASILTPPDATIIWRYMNLEKLLSLISIQKLFLCRLDRFKDPWEGVWPKVFCNEIRNEWLEEDAIGLFSATQKMRSSILVNSWHENKFESAALWDQYGEKSGFAVRSTIGHLKNSISDSRPIYIGKINYIDYAKETVSEVNLLIPTFLKRSSFQHEKEVRIAVFHPPEPINQYIDVNLNILIQEIYLSPTIDEWMVSVISELIDRYNLSSIRIKKSDLYEPHIY
ncbi:MAG: hypothetical protein NTV00_08325 [Methylococcales bacterium]|nr:hypothetical protein [Methylococcales bacterium]